MINFFNIYDRMVRCLALESAVNYLTFTGNGILKFALVFYELLLVSNFKIVFSMKVK